MMATTKTTLMTCQHPLRNKLKPRLRVSSKLRNRVSKKPRNKVKQPSLPVTSRSQRKQEMNSKLNKRVKINNQLRHRSLRPRNPQRKAMINTLIPRIAKLTWRERKRFSRTLKSMLKLVQAIGRNHI